MNEYFKNRKKCPCCGYRDCNEIYRVSYDDDMVRNYLNSFYLPQGGVEFKFLVNQDYIVCECPRCSLVYQKEIPNDSIMQMLYDKWIDPEKVFNKIEKNRGIGYFAAICSEVIRIVRHFDALPSQLDFLDYGMGWGHWSQIAKALGCNVHGTEFSSARLAHAKKVGIKTIGYDDLIYQGYDFINTEQVFEHLSEPKKVLLHLTKCLKPNGRLKISVPNGSGIKRRLEMPDWYAIKGTSKSINPIAPMEHLNCFTKRTLVRFAEDAGLKPVKIDMVKGTNALLQRVKPILRTCYSKIKSIYSYPANVESNIYLVFAISRL